MKNQEDQIDRFFNEGLSNYEEAPSSNVWNALEEQLSAKNSRVNYWIAASIVAVLIASTVVWSNILSKTTSFNYETAENALQVTHPQKEFIPTPIILHSTTVVFIERERKTDLKKDEKIRNITPPATVLSASTNLEPISDLYAFDTKIATNESIKLVYSENEPITIIYKKGNPKYPKLAKAANYLKQVGDGERPLIDFGKISTGLIARRETYNNSNK